MKRNLLKAIGISFLIFVVLSWIIPVGTYSDGKLTTDGTDPVGLFDLFSVPVSTLLTFVLYALVFACIGGLYGVMEKTGALEKWVEKATNRFSAKGFTIFSIIFFVVLSSVTGLLMPLFALVPLFALILIAQGQDKITAMASTVGAMLVGSVCSTYGFNITGYTKNLLSLDMNNQIVAKLILLVILTIALIFFVLKFSKKPETKKAVKKAEVKEVKPAAKKAEVKKTTAKKAPVKKTTAKKPAAKKTTTKTTKKKSTTKNLAVAKDVKKVKTTKSTSIVPLVVIFVLMLVVSMLGMYNWYYGFEIELFNDIHETVMGIEIGDYPIFENLLSGISQLGYWGNTEFIMMMVIASMLIAWLYRLSVNEYVESFIAGVKQMLPTAIYAALASVILYILYQASYAGTGTLVDTMSAKIFDMTDDFNVIITGFSALIGSFFYNDLYYLLSGLSVYVSGFDSSSLSIAGLVIQSMYGIGMIIFPTSVMLIAGLSYFDVSFKKWFKYIWKFALAMFLIVIIVCLILTLL